MRFSLIDRVAALEPGRRIEAVKTVSLAEEYLADHFPQAPVLPGVLMLEGLVQASAWLVRASDNFAHSMVLLKEARGVKYAQFVEPGQTLKISAEIAGRDGAETKLKAQAEVDGALAVSGRLVLRSYNCADADPAQAEIDNYIVARLRELFRVLHRPAQAA